MRRKRVLLYSLSIFLFILSVWIFIFSINLAFAKTLEQGYSVSKTPTLYKLETKFEPTYSLTPKVVRTSAIIIPSRAASSTQLPSTTTPDLSTLINTQDSSINKGTKTYPSSVEVHFVDVGQGDSILIISPEGDTALIDGGSSDSGIVTYLKSQNITKINLMIATHPHEDHIGGLVDVLETIPTDKVITSGAISSSPIFEEFINLITEKNISYTELKSGDTISLGSLKLDFLNPTTLESDQNENSLVFRFTYGKTTILFMGDAGIESENNILARGGNVKANIIKIGHHGSASASEPRFIKEVQPEVAIYSAGLNNGFGHPDPVTINTLQNLGVMVFGTDKYGTLIVKMNQEGYTVFDSKGDLLK
jgi:competence protein ComEC